MLKAIQLGQQLTKKEMKNVTGGEGTCAYQDLNGEVVYGVSMAEAKKGANETALLLPGAHWCCRSCSTASWYHVSTP